MSGDARCPYCDQRHGKRYLCDVAKKILDMARQQGTQFNVPFTELSSPINAADLGLGEPGDTLVRQFVVYAATIPVGELIVPTLIITGQSADGKHLPRWIYPGMPENMHGFAALVAESADLAIVAAATGKTV